MEQMETLEAKRARLALDVEEGVKGAERALEDVETEIERLTQNEAKLKERKALAARARQERERKEKVHKRDEAIRAMEKMLEQFDAKLEKKLEAAQSKADPGHAEVHDVYVCARQVASLGHDLHSITGDREHQRPFNVKDRLGHLARLIHECFVPSFPKPPIEKPWAELFEIAQSQ